MKIKFYTSTIVLLHAAQLFAGSLGGAGSSYFAYQPYHNVFYDQQSAVGVVRMANGFSVVTRSAGAGSTHGASVYLDTSLSVSGYIDLKDTNTMILLSDLRLDNGVSFSSSGKIYGKDRTIFLGGDLNLPNNIILHLRGRVTIDGGGNSINLGTNSQIFVDTGATLTLRNLILSNSRNGAGNPAIKLAAERSQLALDSTVLDMTGDLYFDNGSIFIHNDVVFAGTNSFIYRSCQPSFITSGATLAFNSNTAFDFRPSTTGTTQLLAKDLIFMQDNTSSLYLNGCTLKSTLTGLRLTKGKVTFDNSVSITSQAALAISPYLQDVGAGSHLSGLLFQGWSPNGKFLTFVDSATSKNLYIYRFDGTNLTVIPGCTTTFSGNIWWTAWSPDGQYVAVACAGRLSVYKFDGTTLSELINCRKTVASLYRIALWSPDGSFLAVGTSTPSDMAIYKFDGISLTSPISSGFSYTAGISWSPNGKYLACISNGAYLRIARFDGNSITELLGCTQTLTGWPGSTIMSWSPDGRYLAFNSNVVSNQLVVYSFSGNSLYTMPGCTISISGAATPQWDSTGRYLSVGFTVYGNKNARIYKFENSSLTETPGVVGTAGLTFNPDNSYACANPNANVIIYKIGFKSETAQQAISNSIVFGNSSLGSNYDVNLRLLSRANVKVDGFLNYDNVS